RDARDHIANVFGGTEEVAGLHDELPVAAGKFTGRQAPVRKPEGSRDLQGREIVGREARLVESNADLAALAADQADCRDIRCLFDRVIDLRGDAPKFEIAIMLAPEGESED